jgi:hypothetical protein
VVRRERLGRPRRRAAVLRKKGGASESPADDLGRRVDPSHQ